MIRRWAVIKRGHNHHSRHVVAASVSYGDNKTSYRIDCDGARLFRSKTLSSAVTPSARYSSSDAVLISLPAHHHHNFLSDIINGKSSNQMLNPFLNRKQSREDDGGFWELFKAISSLTNRRHGVDVTLDMPLNSPDTEIIAKEEEESDTKKSTIEDVLVSDTSKNPDNFIHLSRKLNEAIKKLRITSVLEIFDQVRKMPESKLSDKQLGRIITFLADHDVAMSFEALKYYVQKSKAEGRLAPLYLYHYMMSGIKSCKNEREVESLVFDVQKHILEEYSEGGKAVYKYILLPQLAQIVARHKYNRCAKQLVEYFLDEKYPLLNPDLYDNLLQTARRPPFARDDWSPMLPYHRLLSELVSCGHRPKPDVVAKVLHVYYPYRDPVATMEVLASIQQLHRFEDHQYDYNVDFGTLELISILSAKRGAVDLSLLIIEMAESFGYTISESMFEDVILSFAASRQVPQCLGALVDMERSGYIPSRELLRKVAMKLSYDEKRLRYTHHTLTGNNNEGMLSVATMNCLMMGYGIKKNIKSAFDVFHSFQELGLQPDANTATFLMEILYVSTKQRFGRRIYADDSLSPDDVDEVVREIEIVLSTMREKNIESTRHFYHEYARLLCAIGLFDVAKMALEEAVSKNITLQVGTIYLLAVQCAHKGNYEMAREVARLSMAAGCGKQINLLRRINNLQNRKIGVWGRSNNR